MSTHMWMGTCPHAHTRQLLATWALLRITSCGWRNVWDGEVRWQRAGRVWSACCIRIPVEALLSADPEALVSGFNFTTRWQLTSLWCPQGRVCVFWGVFFRPHPVACGILVPQSWIKPMPPAMRVQSLNHWTTKEVPREDIIFVLFALVLNVFQHEAQNPLFLFSIKARCLPSHSAKQPCLQHRPIGRHYQPSKSY